METTFIRFRGDPKLYSRQCVLLYEPSADRHDSNATRGTGDAAGVITSLLPHNRTTLTLTNYFPVCTNVLTISWGAHTRDQSRNESCADRNFMDARRILPVLRCNFVVRFFLISKNHLKSFLNFCFYFFFPFIHSIFQILTCRCTPLVKNSFLFSFYIESVFIISVN